MGDPFERPHTRTQKLIVDGNDVTRAATHAAEMGVAYEYTVSGAIPATAHVIDLNHATVAIEMTIADFADHAGGLVEITNTSASGTAAHTVTLTSGTFDGTNNVATLNAPGEALTVRVLNDGNGRVLANIGAVALSTV